jgi:ubiquitin-protein ligase E3 C
VNDEGGLSEALLKSFIRIRNYLIVNNFIKYVRRYFLTISTPYLNAVISEEEAYKRNNIVIKHPDSNTPTDVLIYICMNLTINNEKLIEEFARELISLPLLTCLISKDCINDLLSWSCFGNIVKFLTSNYVALPPSPNQLFQSGTYLLGNMSSFFVYLDIENSLVLNDDILESYLILCTLLINRYNIPGIFQGKNGVVWIKQGTTVTAAPVPHLLTCQLLTLFQHDKCKLCISRILLPVNDHVNLYSKKSDLTEIKESLSFTGLKIAKTVIKEQQESSTWFTSKWASKITTSLATSLGLRSNKPPISTNIVTSSSSSIDNISLSYQDNIPSSTYIKKKSLIESLCSLWSIIFSMSTQSPVDSIPWHSLCSIVFSTRIIDRLWVSSMNLYKEMDIEYFAHSFNIDKDFLPKKRFAILSLLSCLLPTILLACDDNEIYENGKPLPLHQFVRLVRVFKIIVYRIIENNPLLFNEPSSPSCNSIDLKEEISTLMHKNFQFTIVRSFSVSLSDLYSRWSRKPFCPPSCWEVSLADTSSIKKELREFSNFSMNLIRIMPWSIDYYERIKMVREIIDNDRIAIQGTDDPHGHRSRGTVVHIRRKHVLEDGIIAFNKVGNNIKDRINVKYINHYGEEEAGIDIGGLFKDFITDLSTRVFDPSYGLFSITSNQGLYPNPMAFILYPEDEINDLYIFIGRLMGKAIQENITLQPKFEHFFLSYIQGKYNFMNLINDLGSFDKELYKNLMFLKTYDGDIADLCLTFSIIDDSMGGQKEVNLIPNGSNINVTSANKHRYINCCAKYYLHDRIKRQSMSFFKGLYQVIQPELLSVFCAPELQVLISGTNDGISIEDLKANTRYLGGYSSFDRTIIKFWTVFESMNEEEKSQLLKFVTSCERPPSLGFASLNPLFSIQRVDCSDDLRLPSASTCFNILKLPNYSSKAVMKEKLLTSIQSGAGFDLS